MPGPKPQDLTGQRFGRLVVVKRVHSSGRLPKWECQCDCGRVSTPLQQDLRAGKTQSCGCLHNELLSKSNTTHGMYGTPLYWTWCGMMKRCTDKADVSYGGRGITVHPSWSNFSTFATSVMAEIGDRPPNTTLDRKDNSKGYEPGNVRWATAREQNSNRRDNIVVTANGETLVLAEWARKLGFKYQVLRDRYASGYRPPELFAPVGLLRQFSMTGVA